ncbi:GtrA family protein [Herbiconiux sp. SYSU D00978]|uniref:GtrA family protein n=1 Tax=Herbiconiux sp. SYSU D00978 TaxID=2812562 RepID=UPI001A9587D9|nr:GtrA family protein [Herbiconiux sp. SYSU D00978]
MRGLFAKGWKFLVVGAISAVIELTAFNVFVYALGLDPVTSKVLATGVAMINAYFGNRQWAFRSSDNRGRTSEVFLFFAVNILCLVLGAAIVALGVWVIPDHGPVVLNLINAASIGLVVIVRFAFYHYVVFPERTSSVSVEQRD